VIRQTSRQRCCVYEAAMQSTSDGYDFNIITKDLMLQLLDT